MLTQEKTVRAQCLKMPKPSALMLTNDVPMEHLSSEAAQHLRAHWCTQSSAVAVVDPSTGAFAAFYKGADSEGTCCARSILVCALARGRREADALMEAVLATQPPNYGVGARLPPGREEFFESWGFRPSLHCPSFYVWEAAAANMEVNTT